MGDLPATLRLPFIPAKSWGIPAFPRNHKAVKPPETGKPGFGKNRTAWNKTFLK